MTEPVGRRQASKQATRTALMVAAQRLFAERGFEATTVRDIAAAAEVTERTFYRYFDGKEALLAGEFQSWLEILSAAILARPADEPPLVAVRLGMLSLARTAAPASGVVPPLWIVSDRSSMQGLRRAEFRPLLRLEAAIRDAILARTVTRETDGDGLFRAQVLSRVAVGALRSALIRHRELRDGGQAGAAGLDELLGRAFAIIADQSAWSP
jgi:AcrR family transcriptional regulator